MSKYDPASPEPCERLLAEMHAALKQAHVEEHLRPRAALRIARAYEKYWADCANSAGRDRPGGGSYEDRIEQCAEVTRNACVEPKGKAP